MRSHWLSGSVVSGIIKDMQTDRFISQLVSGVLPIDEDINYVVFQMP